MNRKIAVIAIIAAFVGGMFFAGTPVEADKGGVGALIDELWLAIDSLDGRVTTIENTAPFDPSGLQAQIDFNDGDILQLQTDVSDVDGRVTTLENTPVSNHLYVIQFNNYQAGQRGTVQNGDEHKFDRQMITKGGTLTEVKYGHGIGIGIHLGNQVLAKVYLNDVEIGSCTTTIAANHQICDLNITSTNVSAGDMLEITDFGIVTNGLNSDLDVIEKYGSATITLD